MRLSPVPDVDEVAGQAAGNEEQRVDAYIVAVLGKARRQPLGGNCDAAQAIFVECPGCRILGGALLDLDEGECAAAPGDEVDFAARNAGTAGEDSPAVQAQPPGGERLRPAPARFGDLPVQSLAPSSSARA